MKYTCNQCGKEHDNANLRGYIVNIFTPARNGQTTPDPKLANTTTKTMICEACMQKRIDEVKTAARKMFDNIKLGV